MSLRPSVFARALVGAGFLLCAGRLPAKGRSPQAGYVTAQLKPLTPRLEGYGRVEPVTVLTVTAPETGVITGLRVLPGMSVRAGEKLAELKGPQIRSLLLESQADVRSALAQLEASEKSLAILKQQLSSHLSTRQAVHQAESAVAQARKNFANAQSHLRAVQQMMTVSAPSDGRVLALRTASGELVSAGQPLLTLQTAGNLWLEATYYGAGVAKIRRGMEGLFHPADGERPVPVRVRAVLGSMTAGGGERLGLVQAARGHDWRNGEYGTVSLNLPRRRLVAVPTRALILDRGKWWVMVHTAGGDHPQAVVPGPSRGWETFLESGLKPGAEVVVVNAYLLFHRSIAQHYQLPD